MSDSINYPEVGARIRQQREHNSISYFSKIINVP